MREAAFVNLLLITRLTHINTPPQAQEYMTSFHSEVINVFSLLAQKMYSAQCSSTIT